jgi:prepilin peptidase CpaA
MSLTVIQAVLWTIVLAGLLWGAVTDLKERIIPDELTILIALSGLILCLAARPAEVWLGPIAAAVVFLGFGLLCRYGMIGGGDVKLMAAVTLLVPPHEIGKLLIAIALAGGVLSCVYLGASFFVRSVPLENLPLEAGGGAALTRWFRLESARIASRNQAPYAIAILGGVIWHVAGDPTCFSAMSSLF